MKKINTLLYMLLAGFVALFATGANAQTTWDFSTMSDADKTACQADADNWLLGADRWCYIGGALENAPLVANGTELDYAKGLTFTASAPSAKEEGKAIGFMGIEEQKLEMLFVLPEKRGKGIGKKLIDYGIKNYSINELTVNEQNPQAKGFYEHLGFKVYKREEVDEQGNPYPILYMQLIV